MKKLKEKKFTKIILKLNKLNCIDWNESYDYIDEESSNYFEEDFKKYTVYFDWVVNKHYELDIGEIIIYNSESGDGYELTEVQYNLLLSVCESLFNLERN